MFMPTALLTRSVVRVKNKFKRSLYWWDPADGSINTGDYLSKVMVEKILETRDKKLSDKKSKQNRLFAIGSVLHYAKTGDCLWGTGRNGNMPDSHCTFDSLDVRAVRGPLTREFLLSRGIDCPEVYGDPGILTPWIYPKSLFLGASSHKEYRVVPHFMEDPAKFHGHGENICLPNVSPARFISMLVNSSLVISSSLHGIILAEAYGVPAVLLNAGHREKPFKYDDYYLGTGRSEYLTASSVEEALAMRPLAPPSGFADQQRALLAAFPFDLWLD